MPHGFAEHGYSETYEQNIKLHIQQNAVENVCKFWPFWFRPQCVKDLLVVGLSHCYATYSQMLYINVLVQERRNFSTLAMELRLSCTNVTPLLMHWSYVFIALT